MNIRLSKSGDKNLQFLIDKILDAFANGFPRVDLFLCSKIKFS